jgi:hypothetical protein
VASFRLSQWSGDDGTAWRQALAVPSSGAVRMRHPGDLGKGRRSKHLYNRVNFFYIFEKPQLLRVICNDPIADLSNGLGGVEEIIWTNCAVTTQDRQKAKGYLAPKWENYPGSPWPPL